jgi:hypothetical protein
VDGFVPVEDTAATFGDRSDVKLDAVLARERLGVSELASGGGSIAGLVSESGTRCSRDTRTPRHALELLGPRSGLRPFAGEERGAHA